MEKNSSPVVEQPMSDMARRILERSIEVINDGGEVAIRTNPIAYECGSTPPVLYRAFGSREGLVVAAQAERYRRTMADMVDRFCTALESANSRDELKARVRESMRLAFERQRSTVRRTRAEVIGSAVSRPELRARIVEIDRELTRLLCTSLDRAVAEGWVPGGARLRAIVMWSIGGVSSRTVVEFDEDADYTAEWGEVAVEAIVRALFGDN